uniref:Uncharacterized protein n=1 Tax=Globodera rostochiensis TaxID=31243 RepID=A0A914GRC9_GLORO
MRMCLRNSAFFEPVERGWRLRQTKKNAGGPKNARRERRAGGTGARACTPLLWRTVSQSRFVSVQDQR